MSQIEKKLESMGITLPEVAAPLAAYIPGIECGELIFTSGQLPSKNGEIKKGKLGQDISVEEAYEAAKTSAVNCLAVVKSIAGDLDKIEKVIKVTGFVNATLDFESQPAVINGASEFLVELLGEAGKHSRSAVGVSSLPLNACCEVEMIVKIKK